jgi:hypothetical protein
MTRLGILLLVLLLLPASVRAQMPTWMVGCWERPTRSGVSLESWRAPVEGVMHGTSKPTRADGTVAGSEILSVAPYRNTLAYVAVPSDQSRTVFPAEMLSADSVRFELAIHDFPQRIAYFRHGADSMTARVENLDGQGFTIGWHRVACAGS